MSKLLIAKLQHWYVGEYRWHDNDPYFRRVQIGGWYERHWTARAARALVEGTGWRLTLVALLAVGWLTMTFKHLG